MTIFQNMLIALLTWNVLGFVITIWVIQYCFSRYICELKKIHKDILSISKFLLGCQWDALREWQLNQVHQRKESQTSFLHNDLDPDA